MLCHIFEQVGKVSGRTYSGLAIPAPAYLRVWRRDLHWTEPRSPERTDGSKGQKSEFGKAVEGHCAGVQLACSRFAQGIFERGGELRGGRSGNRCGVVVPGSDERGVCLEILRQQAQVGMRLQDSRRRPTAFARGNLANSSRFVYILQRVDAPTAERCENLLAVLQPEPAHDIFQSHLSRGDRLVPCR